MWIRLQLRIRVDQEGFVISDGLAFIIIGESESKVLTPTFCLTLSICRGISR